MGNGRITLFGTEPMKTYAVLAIAVLCQATGNVFLSKGMKTIVSTLQVGEGNLLSVPFHAFVNPMIWIGVGLSIIFYILFASALSWTDLSLVLPIASVEVVLNVAFAAWFLNEMVSSKRWAGAVLIAVGVILVIRSTSRNFKTSG
jgi:uncharacterized membrane protein